MGIDGLSIVLVGVIDLLTKTPKEVVKIMAPFLHALDIRGHTIHGTQETQERNHDC